MNERKEKELETNEVKRNEYIKAVKKEKKNKRK